MSAIYRKAINGGEIFSAPQNVTFAFQLQRGGFSVWYVATDPMDTFYAVLPTGVECDGLKRIVQSVVLPDGFTVFHLCEIEPKKGGAK